ncbi:hypothetical protein B0O99DRAFT_688136 [Bisporella sp. PMI_857]|nr:hypothetical protein B0O99DRAFT_688136 [Bisporella sp. PMI_857]
MGKSQFKQTTSARSNSHDASPSYASSITGPLFYPPIVAVNGHKVESVDDQDSRGREILIPGAPLQPSRTASNKIRDIMPFVIIILSTFVQVLCSIVIVQFDPSHTKSSLSSPLNFNVILQRSISAQLDYILPFRISDFFIDPSEFEFATAVMVYGLAMLMFYDARKNDPHRDYFLVGGMCLGLVAGLGLSIRDGTTRPYRAWIPTSITIALLLSIPVHSIKSKKQLLQI